jgi:lantibiotic modifying enzyme
MTDAPTAFHRPGEPPLLCSHDLLLKAASVVKGFLLRHASHLQYTNTGLTEGQAAADFYSGPLGLALFWAAMEAVTRQGSGEDLERSFQILGPIRRRIAHWVSHQRSLEKDGVELGGLSGIGAVIYTFTCIGDLLNEPELLREAKALAESITPTQVSHDRHFDLFFGSSGAILALLALEQTLACLDLSEVDSASRSLLTRAEVCAQHLIESRSSYQGGPRAWLCSGQMHSGVPHGAAGIAYALLRLYERVSDPRLLDAALEAMEFERTLFRPQEGNWLLYAGSREDLGPTSSWCRGAPGIALARTATLHLVKDPQMLDEIQFGLQTTRDLPHRAEDDLCCGNLGRAEILSEVGHVLAASDPDSGASCLAAADRIVYQVLRRAKRNREFTWSKRPLDGTFNPGFFQGAAGLGYAFLHLACPGALPQPLLLAPLPSRPLNSTPIK